MSTELKHKILSGVFWQGLNKFGVQMIQLVIQIILARLLAPIDFAPLVILLVFIQLSQVFIDSGFGAALIQGKEISKTDWNSVFWLNIMIAVLIYGLLFCFAPWISDYFKMPELTLMLRVIALTLIINAVAVVPGSIINREMLFKKMTFSTLPSVVAGGGAGIAMALHGFGTWSLIGQQIIISLVSTAILLGMVRWVPHWGICWSSVKRMFHFGHRLLISSLIDVLFNNIYYIIIGKYFSPLALSFYNRGRSWPQFLIAGVNGTIAGVMFPAFSKCQHDPAMLKQLMQQSIRISYLLLSPMLFGLAAVAEPLTVVLLGEKWLPSVVYLRWMCLVFLFWPLHVFNLQVILGCGRSDIYLKLEIIKKIIAVAVILISIYWGVIGMVIGQAIMGGIYFIINARPCKQLINYSAFDQFCDIAKYLILGTVIFAVIMVCNQFITLRPLFLLLMHLGIGLFVTLIVLWKFPTEIIYLKKILKNSKN